MSVDLGREPPDAPEPDSTAPREEPLRLQTFDGGTGQAGAGADLASAQDTFALRDGGDVGRHEDLDEKRTMLACGASPVGLTYGQDSGRFRSPREADATGYSW